MAKQGTEKPSHPRMLNELATIGAMITLYCKARHNFRGTLCPDCSELLEYAKKRLYHCPFQENKPTCGKCSVHCYKPEMREKIREVMRFAGPRMIAHHPLMALRHLLDGCRKTSRFPGHKKNSTDKNGPDPEQRRTSE